MNRYTIYCTTEQTKMALELGAPIERGHDRSRYFNIGVPTFFDENDEICRVKNSVIFIPTAEELIGYLEEKYSLHFLTGIDDEDKFFFNVYHTEGYIEVRGCNSRKEATLATIDSALEYLSNKAMEE